MNADMSKGDSGRVTLLTGASRGIGRALLELLLENSKRSDRIIGISRTPDGELLAAAEKAGVEMTWIPINLSKPLNAVGDLEPLFSKLAAAEHSRYALVNNAGMLDPIARLGSGDAQALADNMNLNAAAPLILMDLFMKYFGGLDADRRIINISSGAARSAYPGWAAYCSSKAALDMASLCLKAEQEGRENPVRIASFAPGVVDTAMQDRIRKADAADFPLVERFHALKNDGHLLDPEIPAAVILRLLETEDFPQEVQIDIREMSL